MIDRLFDYKAENVYAKKKLKIKTMNQFNRFRIVVRRRLMLCGSGQKKGEKEGAERTTLEKKWQISLSRSMYSIRAHTTKCEIDRSENKSYAPHD